MSNSTKKLCLVCQFEIFSWKSYGRGKCTYYSIETAAVLNRLVSAAHYYREFIRRNERKLCDLFLIIIYIIYSLAQGIVIVDCKIIIHRI